MFSYIPRLTNRELAGLSPYGWTTEAELSVVCSGEIVPARGSGKISTPRLGTAVLTSAFAMPLGAKLFGAMVAVVASVTVR